MARILDILWIFTTGKATRDQPPSQEVADPITSSEVDPLTSWVPGSETLTGLTRERTVCSGGNSLTVGMFVCQLEFTRWGCRQAGLHLLFPHLPWTMVLAGSGAACSEPRVWTYGECSLSCLSCPFLLAPQQQPRVVSRKVWSCS